MVVATLLLLTATASDICNSGESDRFIERENALAWENLSKLPEVIDRPLEAKIAPYARVVVNTHKSVGSGQCVSLAQAQGFRISGVARMWPTNAKLAGYKVDTIPTIGSILVTGESSAGTNTGHVTGQVQKIENGYAYVDEQNYVSKTITEGWVPISRVVAVIHAL